MKLKTPSYPEASCDGSFKELPLCVGQQWRVRDEASRAEIYTRLKLNLFILWIATDLLWN